MKPFFVLFAILFPAFVFAQRTITVRVMDAKSSKPVDSVLIISNSTGLKTMTNKTGYFQLAADSGQVLSLSRNGYVSMEIGVPKEVVFRVEMQPKAKPEPIYFADGMPKLYNFLASNIRYISSARQKGIQGRFFVSFALDSGGNLGGIKILNPLAEMGGLDTEIHRILKLVPKEWNPIGFSKSFLLPITFQIGDNKVDSGGVDDSNYIRLPEIVCTAYSGVKLQEKSDINTDPVLRQVNQNELILEFSMEGMGLQVLHPDIRKFKKLRKLNLDKNKLTTLPEELGELSNLEELYAFSNRISQMPNSVSNLQKLKTLGLATNKLKVFPDALLKLENLEALDLADNLITVLPIDIGNLKNLKVLILAKNEITSLPQSLASLSLLIHLDIKGNKIPIEQIEALKMALPSLEVISK